MLDDMNGRTLVREARRRAGLTQAELAERTGTTQSAIARLEAGATAPSFERVDSLVRACGLTLVVDIDDGARVDPDEWQRAERNLELTSEERFANVVRAAQFVLAGREAGRRRRR